MTFKISSKAPVLVTGANGFVASWLVKRLVEEGLTVHATVRDISDQRKVSHLDTISKKGPGTVKLFEADLLKKGSFIDAMEKCTIVFHTASPFIINAKRINNPQIDFYNPIVDGTENILQAVEDTKTVKKVILTSSIAAIYGDLNECLNSEKGRITEKDWNKTSSINHIPYSYSKTMGEKLAWQKADKQNRWELIAINPPIIVGPSIAGFSTSGSDDMIKSFVNGSLKAGAPPVSFGMVDVRDVAEAHLRAAFMRNIKGRYIILDRAVSFLEVAQILTNKFGKKVTFPKKEIPKWLLWLVGPIFDKSITRRFVSNSIGYKLSADKSKSIQELKMTYLPVERALEEMYQQLLDNKPFQF